MALARMSALHVASFGQTVPPHTRDLKHGPLRFERYRIPQGFRAFDVGRHAEEHRTSPDPRRVARFPDEGRSRIARCATARNRDRTFEPRISWQYSNRPVRPALRARPTNDRTR